MITGPRIWSVRPVIGGKTSASWPSTNVLSIASTVTVCAWFQVPPAPPVKTSCCVITAPPRLSGVIATPAESRPPSSRVIVRTRPTTETR